MPEPAETGVKDNPTGPPPEGTGAAGANTAGLSGPPPEDGFVYEDDEVIEQDGRKMVPLDALIKARKSPSREPEPQPASAPKEEEPDEPLFNWDKLVQPSTGGAQAQAASPLSPEEYEEQFREQLNERPWQAIMWAVQTGMQMRDRMEQQARGFVPDYGNLPVHEIRDEEIQALAQNPYAMRALLAKARMAGSGKQAARVNSPPAATAQRPPAAAAPSSQEQMVQEIVRQTMSTLTGMGRQSGVSGESTSGPSSPPASRGEVIDLDPSSVAFLKARGYSDEQIREKAKEILDRRRKKGLVM